ncbi:hypothetical protein [Leifsonia sp. AG29]|uniref:hypothetical protein n=1 Tax=Leifsonia sp. AG29 TaxID=2598860 RepID=UPI00131D6B10|nr:hypothetical protein [Leifsonia sp. AG29]
MTCLLRVGTALTGGCIITAAFAVISLVWIMFSTGPGDGRSTGLFGAIFFEARERADGALDVGVGLENPVPLILVFVVTSAFVLAVTIVMARLRAYKRELGLPAAE